MMAEHYHRVLPGEQGMRLDALLASLVEVSSRSEAVRLVEQGKVTLNQDMVTSKKRLVLEGDEIVFSIERICPPTLQGEDIALDIRYEDDSLIVLSKQAGLVIHPAHGHESGTLVNALVAYCGYNNLALLQGDDRPGIVHRLDKDTSGLMLAAKNNRVGSKLQDDIRTKNMERYYIALVHGTIAPDTGLVDAPLARGGVDRQRIVVKDDFSARQSVTTFTVLERFDATRFDDGFTLLDCKLHTGRTHQIRVHMEYIGHPLVGDPLYGPQNRPKAQHGLSRQFLHSWRLCFTHPDTGEEMEFFDPLPDDLQQVLEDIESYSRGRTEAGNTLACMNPPVI